MSLVWRHEVGTPVTEVFKDGLTLKDDEIWNFNAHIFSGPAITNLSVYFNNDTNVTHYHTDTIQSTHGAAVTGAQTDDSVIMALGAGDKVIINGVITFISRRKLLNFQMHIFKNSDETLIYKQLQYTLADKDEDVYKITVRSDVANAIARDSDFRMWRAF